MNKKNPKILLVIALKKKSSRFKNYDFSHFLMFLLFHCTIQSFTKIKKNYKNKTIYINNNNKNKYKNTRNNIKVSVDKVLNLVGFVNFLTKFHIFYHTIERKKNSL